MLKAFSCRKTKKNERNRSRESVKFNHSFYNSIRQNKDYSSFYHNGIYLMEKSSLPRTVRNKLELTRFFKKKKWNLRRIFVLVNWLCIRERKWMCIWSDHFRLWLGNCPRYYQDISPHIYIFFSLYLLLYTRWSIKIC